ncbi:MAG: hypothetical protein ACRYGF_00915, partial [Janthinobacterium lividum]
SGAAYHYTADGTLATCESPALTGPISLAGHENHINVQVIGCGSGLIRSHLVSLHYTMDVPVTHGVVQSAAAVQGAQGAPITVSLPAAPKAGNRLYAFLSSGSDKYAGTITAPPGFSLITATQVDGFSKLSVYTSTSFGSGSYTFSTSANRARMTVVMLEVTGTNGVDKFSTASKLTLSDGRTTRTTGAVTPTAVGDMALAAFAGGSAGAENGPTASPGWTVIQAPGTGYNNLTVAVRSAFATDTTTAIQNAFNAPMNPQFDQQAAGSNTITLLLRP